MAEINRSGLVHGLDAAHRAALAFGRVWQETGCGSVIERLASCRGHEFSLERAAFLTVLHRQFAGGSDRAADRWREYYAIQGVEDLDLHHLYRAMAWLGEELPAASQDAATPLVSIGVEN